MNKSIRKMTAFFNTSISQIHIQKFIIDYFSHIEGCTIYNYNWLLTEENLISIKAVQVGYIFNWDLEVNSQSFSIIISSYHKPSVWIESN